MLQAGRGWREFPFMSRDQTTAMMIIGSIWHLLKQTEFQK
jgi:hypothetical protein